MTVQADFTLSARLIPLTTLGSRFVRMAATPGVIDNSVLALIVECDYRIWNAETRTLEPERTSYALTAEEARALVAQIAEVLGAVEEGGRRSPRHARAIVLTAPTAVSLHTREAPG